jgi:hypothetical protein
MSARAIEKYQSIQEEEARYFAQSVLGSPDDLFQHVNRWAQEIFYALAPKTHLFNFFQSYKQHHAPSAIRAVAFE